MAEDINRVVIVGRLTRDAELMYTSNNYPLCKISIASNRKKKQGDQWVDEGNFFEVSLWGRRGESLAQYLVKGQQVAVEGQLRQDRWEQDGAKRSKVVIEATNVQLLGGRSGNEGGSRRPSYSQQPSSQGTSGDSYIPADDSFEDDVPF